MIKSIRLRLLSYILGVFVSSLSVLTFVSYLETSHEIEEVFDSELAQTARMLSQFTLANIDSKGNTVSIPEDTQHVGHKYENHISYQVWYYNALALHSESAPDLALAKSAGFSNVTIKGKKWRVFSLYPESSAYRIYTAEDYTARDELAFEIVLKSLEVFFWSLPILAILIYISLSHGLRSLTELSTNIRLRDVNQLKPLDLSHVPNEVLPLVTALNELLARLDVAILKEKQFTSNASHELRTPLSGIKLHAQLALKSATDKNQIHSLQQIIKSVDMSTVLVEQLLTLNSLDLNNHVIKKSPVDLILLCEDIILELEPLVQRHQAEIILKMPSDGSVISSNAELLHIIIQNLLVNAMRHVPGKVKIILTVSSQNNQTEISIEDNGPGIADESMEQVTLRFYRLANQDIDGSGLGLSIVKESANKIDCHFSLEKSKVFDSGLLASIKCKIL